MRQLIMVLSASLILLTGCHQSFYGPYYIMKPRNDMAIMEDVKHQLIEDKRVNAKKILVSSVQGTVILTGTVRSIKESYRAADIASQVQGVQFVQNEIVVRR